jgi:hypothetical protein
MLKFIELLSALMAWLQLMIAPTLVGGIIGLLVYYYKPDKDGKIIAIAITILGSIVGVIWASKLWRKTGTLEYLIKGGHDPELDKYADGPDKQQTE